MTTNSDFTSIIQDLLQQPAIDANGAQIQIDGKDANYLQTLCKQLLNKAFKDANLGWKILQQAGVIAPDVNEEQQTQRKVAVTNYESDLKKKKAEIKKLLKKSGTEDPAIELQIELTARDWLAYERACLNYATNIDVADPDTQNQLSDQMRRWSATVRDDLTKLTMNVKDSERTATNEEDMLSQLYSNRD